MIAYYIVELAEEVHGVWTVLLGFSRRSFSPTIPGRLRGDSIILQSCKIRESKSALRKPQKDLGDDIGFSVKYVPIEGE